MTTTNADGELREQLKLAIILELIAFKATSCNAYMHFHGQEEGEDPTMDRYWKQEVRAEEALYRAIETEIAKRLGGVLDELEANSYLEQEPHGQNGLRLRVVSMSSINSMRRKL